MNLSHINQNLSDIYIVNNAFIELKINDIYQVLELSRRKTMFGSIIKVNIKSQIYVCIPSFNYQNFFEQDPSLYYYLKNQVNICKLFIKYLGHNQIQFLLIDKEK